MLSAFRNFISTIKENFKSYDFQQDQISMQYKTKDETENENDQLSLSTWCCNNETSEVCENAIRERAYQLWEEAGRPCGDGENFWLAAKQELTIKSFGVGT